MQPRRLVLDTNVWLDWLVFDDPGIAPIRAAAAAGTAEIFINSECEAELARVLAYPRPRTTLDTAAPLLISKSPFIKVLVNNVFLPDT